MGNDVCRPAGTIIAAQWHHVCDASHFGGQLSRPEYKYSLSVRYGAVMLRHRSAQLRMNSSAIAAMVLAFGSLSIATGASANPTSPDEAVTQVADSVKPCCAEVLPDALPDLAPDALPEALPEPAPEALPEPAPDGLPEPAPEAVADALPEPAPEALPEPAPEAAAEPAPEAAADLHTDDVVMAVHVGSSRHLLAAGPLSERGMQVKTILVERAVHEMFPQINSMIGVRPDSKPWHPNGLAVDIMIPNAGSASGIALGNAIRDYALSHVAQFGIQDVIWRGTYYTPAGPSGSGYGHFDHVHITTTGGGYPSGGEDYVSP